MLIDTHCHLDAREFDHDRQQVIASAREAELASIVIPAVAPYNYSVVRRLAAECPGGAYALGIHPLYVDEADDMAIEHLRAEVTKSLDDPRFVAIGEIGLDLFIKPDSQEFERQHQLFVAQLKLAADFDMPVLLHIRRAQDLILKQLRSIRVPGGIAHAYNGSMQQTEMFLNLNMALGIGGAMTYTRALQIRRIARETDLKHLVLETDAPDIPPAWLHGEQRRNTPEQVAGVALSLAELREEPLGTVVRETGAAAVRVLPRLSEVVCRSPAF